MTQVVPMVPVAAPPLAAVPVQRDLRAQSIPEFINKAVALIVLKLMFPERRIADAAAPEGVRIIPGISQDEIADVIQGENFRRLMGESFVDYAKRVYLGAPARQNFSFSLTDRIKISAFSMLRSSGAINVILRSVLNKVIDQVTANPDRVVGNLFQVIDEALMAYRTDLRSFATAIEPVSADGRVAATVQRAPYEGFITTAIDSLLPQKIECFTTLRSDPNRIKRAVGNALNKTVGSLFSKAVNYGARRYQAAIVSAVVNSFNGRQIAQIITSDGVVDPILRIIQAQIPGIKRIVELRLTTPAAAAPVATAAPAVAAEEPAATAPAERLPQAAARLGSIMGNAIRLLNVEAVAAERARRGEDTRVAESEAGMLTESLAEVAERAAAPVFNLVYPQLVAFLSEPSLAQQLDNTSRAVFGYAPTRQQEAERTERVARNVEQIRADIVRIAESTATFAARTGASTGFGVLKGRVVAAVASRTAWMPFWMRTTAKVAVGVAGLGIVAGAFPAVGAATLTAVAVTAAGGLVAGTAGIQRAGSALLVAPLIDGAPRLATSEALLQRLLEGSLCAYAGQPVAVDPVV